MNIIGLLKLSKNFGKDYLLYSNRQTIKENVFNEFEKELEKIKLDEEDIIFSSGIDANNE